MSGKKSVLCMSLLVRHAHVGRFRLRWRSGVHPEERWHHCHKVSRTESHAVCAAATLCSRNLLPSASLTIKRTDLSKALVCPIRGALCPDLELLRNSHSSTPLSQGSLSTYSSSVRKYAQTHTNNRADSVCVSWHELTNQFEQRWWGWKGLIVRLNVLIILISTDRGA